MPVLSLQIASIISAWTNIGQSVASFGIGDLADVCIVAGIIYLVLIFIKQTRSYFILTAILVLLVMKFISESFDLELTKKLIEPLLATLALVVVVLFQRDIRRFFKWISAGKGFAFTPTIHATTESLAIIADTIWEMASNRIGAIIVFPGEASIDYIVEGGVSLDGEISRPLILSIFDSNSPGHDGAMLIESNRIKKFGLHLPLAEDFKSIQNVGTRHRAATGVTQKTDALAIVVSEERGEVSIAQEGSLRVIDNKEGLLDTLKEFSNSTDEMPKSFWYYLIMNNMWVKIASVALSFILWIVVR